MRWREVKLSAQDARFLGDRGALGVMPSIE